jgi:chemotaxis protein MotB
MGKKDWQRALEDDGLTDLPVPARRGAGNGWRIVTMLLLVATGAFVGAYYVPLYRAHGTLAESYQKLSTESQTQRKQLTDTITTLKLVSEERDRLATQSRAKKRDDDASKQRAERLEGSLSAALKKYLGKGRVELKRDAGQLTLSLAAPAVIGKASADLTDFGKKALCAAVSPLKSNSAKLLVSGTSGGKDPFSFALAADRANGVAKQLGEACGLDAAAISTDVARSAGDASVGAMIKFTFDD